ncbi:glycosyltransferase [Paludibacterium purpuratum]|uniref:Glycosyltransferase involved in cell wall biosynthesis n=1 Tax=Paludibacterium purpuratum TaxID=1144873 RepID=A0A4R7B1B8_9NEIS|nr:glycosyltransferase [Paludibacterium purpuratum]TDR76719.1 glycosyltransferase involved in cell wall biosynthesis [Paludibacterium purpuratum]
MTISVAHIMRTYGVHGGERQLAQLFSSYDDKQFEHCFFFIYKDEQCKRYFNENSTIKTKTLLALRSRTFPRMIQEFATLLALLPILQILFILNLLRSGSQIVVAHGVQAALVVWPAACLFRSRSFVYMHRGTKSKQGQHPLFSVLYRPFKIVAAVSHASADSLRMLAPAKKIRVIENGINIDQFTQKEIDRSRVDKILRIACIGRLIPAKGQELLLDTIAGIKQVHPDCLLQLIGEGPSEPSLRAHAQALGITANVSFTGHSASVAQLLADSDIFVSASRSEGLSNAVLEAMACGLPSVVIDAPGVSECHIEGLTAYITPRDSGIVAKKILDLAGNVELQQRMGAAARHRAESHYSISANCHRYSMLYRELSNIGMD